MPAKQKQFNDAQVQAFAKTMLKESLGLILPVTVAVNKAMREDFLEFLKDHEQQPTEKAIDAAISTVTLSWCLAFYLTFYIEESPKYEYKQTASYKYFLQKLLDEIDTATNGTLNLKIIQEFATGQAINALSAMDKGGLCLMWWDMFYCLYDIRGEQLPQPGLISNMEMAAYAAEIEKVEVAKSARIKKAFQNIALVG